LSLFRIQYSGHQLHPFSCWISKHSNILQSLDITFCSVTACAAFGQALATAGGPLHLRVLRCNMLHHNLLKQLSATHLTHLTMGSHHEREYWGALSSSSSIALDAFRQLTNLRALELESENAEKLLPAIPALQQLTQLHLNQLTFRSVPELRDLPSIIQDLSINVAPNFYGFQVRHRPCTTIIHCQASCKLIASDLQGLCLLTLMASSHDNCRTTMV
jgi:hypothetical protein